jgi:hypothetical protein
MNATCASVMRTKKVSPARLNGARECFMGNALRVEVEQKNGVNIIGVVFKYL